MKYTNLNKQSLYSLRAEEMKADKWIFNQQLRKATGYEKDELRREIQTIENELNRRKSSPNYTVDGKPVNSEFL